MIGAIFVVETGLTPSVAKRDMPILLRPMWEQLGVKWHRSFSDKHFTQAGAREYGYQKRSGEGEDRSRKGWWGTYTGRKLRRKGHTRPLEFSGVTRQLVKMRDVRPTSKGVRIVIHANALNLRPRGGTINMREEMTRISDREQKILIDLANTDLDQRIKNHKPRRRRRIA